MVPFFFSPFANPETNIMRFSFRLLCEVAFFFFFPLGYNGETGTEPHDDFYWTENVFFCLSFLPVFCGFFPFGFFLLAILFFPPFFTLSVLSMDRTRHS